MVILNFTLSEEGVAVLHDALACLFKFSDDVCLEARRDKSLLTIFRARHNSGDQSREKNSAIESCDVAIDDGLGRKSRLVARVSFRNGITASHSLPFEVKPPMHAKFNPDEACNRWAISSRTLRQLMDHFGPGIELLDINTDNDTRVVNFTCFTEKVQKRGAVNNEEVLKKPLHTNIAVEMDEFDHVNVEDKLHIIISVKDFRAILQHAQLISGELTTCYSNPGRPMKLSYSADGIVCEFILMTVGEKDALSQKHKNLRANTASKIPRPELDASSHRASSVANSSHQNSHEVASAPVATPTSMPAPPQLRTSARPRNSAFEIRPQPIPPHSAATAQSESLFVSQGDEDEQWEPVNPEGEDEENARLEWNATNDPNPSSLRIGSYLSRSADPQEMASDILEPGLEPTQRLSQVRRFGLFSP
ncbi:putative DNA repair protein [Thermochaetoides thermophila DSM 1495]|uniref:DNA repair protein rad9 n=1 Tax=Chaetomium thermophilum (strain DSM 1495 / CBS 144.50 / IMI 039719) TaxID=759272 RepID=G0S6V9_CHATD|nr:putative DNA repair protein [Thermochaetoides thermophila DSM 1495]EGS20867.1 putative DNA repair protein [Thermochaetoides thermophila DSM 1495]